MVCRLICPGTLAGRPCAVGAVVILNLLEFKFVFSAFFT